jgi:hypothetical protein
VPVNNDGYHAGIGITPRKSSVHRDFDATVLFSSGRLAASADHVAQRVGGGDRRDQQRQRSEAERRERAQFGGRAVAIAAVFRDDIAL